ncbi:hypothetical protein, partial [Mycoplasmopsis verecunda]
MGKWHSISQFAKSLRDVINDVPLRYIYQKEKELGWTDTDVYDNWFRRFKTNVLKFTNKKLIEFIPYNTYNNLDYKKRNGISMKSIKKKNQDRK